MRRVILLLFFVYSFSLPQDIQHEAIAINIEVQVRVFKGDTFIDNLRINDFELFEEGVLQNIEAVYLIKKKEIAREEIGEDKDTNSFAPQISRQFVLIFELRNYIASVEHAIQYMLEEVILPGDGIIMVTPFKTYNIKKDAWEKLNGDEISTQLIGILRRDVFATYSDEKYIDGRRLLYFANYLKKLPGQKNVFLFLEQEIIEKPLETGDSIYGNFNAFEQLDLINEISSNNSIDPKDINNAFADSSILFQFLYLKTIQTKANLELESASSLMEIDISEGFYNVFRGVVDATGGITDVSTDALISTKKAADALENYYLLYYTPKAYKSDGKFRNIKVKVKGGNYRVLHRAGYLAD